MSEHEHDDNECATYIVEGVPAKIEMYANDVGGVTLAIVDGADESSINLTIDDACSLNVLIARAIEDARK